MSACLHALHRISLLALCCQCSSQQIQFTQTSIARSLDLDAAGVPEVSRVRLEDQDAIRIGDQKGVHLTGRFDWRLPGDAVKVDSAFELYLERGERGSWRLAIPRLRRRAIAGPDDLPSPSTDEHSG